MLEHIPRLIRGGVLLADKSFTITKRVWRVVKVCILCYESVSTPVTLFGPNKRACLQKLKSAALMNPSKFQTKTFLLEGGDASMLGPCHFTIKVSNAHRGGWWFANSPLACEKAAYHLLRDNGDANLSWA